MTVLQSAGDEVQGEKVICVYRKRGDEILIHQTEGHRALRMTIKGLPARAIVDKQWIFKQ
jgi:hypothetical protein